MWCAGEKKGGAWEVLFLHLFCVYNNEILNSISLEIASFV